ncbi:MAG: anaerobic ribonucleoside-triphosphate reductase activating protein [Bacteroidales bacterium]|nr:anaerobic ribonucleoside-triphosphate reductase activating protein [Bacteroidales bacterium]
MLKYYNYDIVFQEIPDEVTLAVNLTNCPHRCVGCHSPHLREDIGDVLNDRTLDSLLKKYGQQITCVCFMGGDGQAKDVETLAKHLRQHSKLKVAWYSGNAMLPRNAQLFDYVKVGGYKPELGGLRSRTTNQRLYRYTNGHSEDITSRFWKK